MPFFILSKQAEKDFSRLPKVNKKRIIKKIKILRNEPFSGKPLVGELKGLFSVRAWPYRIIYEYSRKFIVVHRILHRQGAYNK